MIDKPPNNAGAHCGSAAGPLASQTSHSLQLAARFGLTGLTTTLAYFLLTNVFVLLFKMAAISSSACAYLVSVAISYLLQSRFTFRVNGDSLDQVARFLLTSLAGLVVSCCVMAFIVLMHWPYLIGAIGVCLIVPAMNFFVMRGWVFAMQQT
jgi:putative flippase GtrA